MEPQDPPSLLPSPGPGSTGTLVPKGTLVPRGTSVPKWRLQRLTLGEAVQATRNVDWDEIRPVDLRELEDALHPAVRKERCPEDLALALGMLSKGSVTYRVVDDTGPIFLCTKYPTEKPGVKMLCGFAWEKGQKRLNLREQLQVTTKIIDELIGDRDTYLWVCYVHKENARTLNLWRWVGKRHDRVNVEISTSNENKDYNVVKVYYLF